MTVADLRPFAPTVVDRQPVLTAKGIRKTLGTGEVQFEVLRGIDISILPGELTLLMGPSGSGKTTLLSILGCILTPTEGEIEIAGEPASGLSPDKLAQLRRRHIGFVFQSYNLFPTLNALENVRVALDVRGMSSVKAKERSEAALREVGLGHRLKNYPRNLSGGEQQRVAVARALAGEPSIVLADEPTAALDGENGQAVMALLARIAKSSGRAVLAVTHDHRTLSYADRIIHIEDGVITGDERPGTAASPKSKTRQRRTEPKSKRRASHG